MMNYYTYIKLRIVNLLVNDIRLNYLRSIVASVILQE